MWKCYWLGCPTWENANYILLPYFCCFKMAVWVLKALCRCYIAASLVSKPSWMANAWESTSWIKRQLITHTHRNRRPQLAQCRKYNGRKTKRKKIMNRKFLAELFVFFQLNNICTKWFIHATTEKRANEKRDDGIVHRSSYKHSTFRPHSNALELCGTWKTSI